MKLNFPATPRQQEMLTHPARILWIGTATKTGKSAASYAWISEGLLRGQACGFVGAWFYRSKRAFDECKTLLQPFIARREVRVNEARLQLTSAAGGYCDFLSGDNPDSLFGSNFDRLVLDEASRMPAAIYPAALTVISATNGKLRLLFNLELGSRNWSISNLLRVQKLSPAERERTGENYMMFPVDPLLVSAELVETLRTQMPEPLWRALYRAEIFDSDVGLFRNLDKIFVGHERETPAEGSRYFLGLDLAKRQDYTAATVIDDEGNVVAMARFTQLDWSLQIQKVALLYRTFRCVRCVADSTGVGDPVCEQLEAAGMEVERFTFTTPSRKALLEELILATDNAEYTIPASNRFHIYRQELESFEFVLDGTTTKYQAPGHDDTTMSLALAVHAYRSNRGMVFGLIDLLKRRAKDIAEGIRDKFGELIHKPESEPIKIVPFRKPEPPKPVVVQENPFETWQRTSKSPPCPACKSTATTYIAGPKLHCNNCGADEGVVPAPKPAANGTCPVVGEDGKVCGLKLNTTGGVQYCQNHGQLAEDNPVPRGATFKDLKRSPYGFALRVPTGRFR